MDPNLFHIDWDQLLEVLAAVIVLAFVVERALAIVFEHRWYKKFHAMGLKTPIALVVSVAICAIWKLDLVSVMLKAETTSFLGYLLTGAVIAGGSKASIKLFHDVLKVRNMHRDAVNGDTGGGDTGDGRNAPPKKAPAKKTPSKTPPARTANGDA